MPFGQLLRQRRRLVRQRRGSCRKRESRREDCRLRGARQTLHQRTTSVRSTAVPLALHAMRYLIVDEQPSLKRRHNW